MSTVQQAPARRAETPPSDGASTSRWLAASSGAAALAGCAVLALADPSEPGRYGLCPFYVATGWWCPLCGSLRAVHHLTRGDLVAAAGSNLLLVLGLPVLIYAWAAWALPRFGLRGPPQLRMPPWAWWSLLGVLLVFGLLRNLAPFAWFAPEVVWIAPWH